MDVWGGGGGIFSGLAQAAGSQTPNRLCKGMDGRTMMPAVVPGVSPLTLYVRCTRLVFRGQQDG